MNKTVYLVFGARGSGRAAVVSDLVEFGLDPTTSVELCVSKDEVGKWNGLAAANRDGCEMQTYEWKGAGLDFGQVVGECVFIVADGLADPADSVEAFYEWLQGSEYELARVICVVDCHRAYEEEKLIVWYDCCIHFSDVVLLANRHGVSNKWVDEFKERYIKQYYPCLFDFVKRGRVANPSLILYSEVRRMTKLFDDADEFAFDDDDEEDELFEGEEANAGDPSKDPFLAKRGSGQRQKPVPDIRSLGIFQ